MAVYPLNQHVALCYGLGEELFLAFKAKMLATLPSKNSYVTRTLLKERIKNYGNFLEEINF